MGMTNDEINTMLANGSMPENNENKTVRRSERKERSVTKVKNVTKPVVEEDDPVDPSFLISQADVDSVLASFVSDDQDNKNKQSLLEEIHTAILDSGRLTLAQWRNLRNKLSEIEALIPHIDLIIRLKSKKERTALE